MQKFQFMTPILILFLGVLTPAYAAQQPACAKNDSVCLEFSKLMEAEQYEKIVEKADVKKTYSREARDLIGQAYLMIAGREGNTAEQEELYCKKALEFGATSAYMGLYFINADRNADAALAYLRQYIETKPKDSVPYVILGESELSKEHYEKARQYFVDARKVAHGRSANLDWLLFQASYLSGDYATASAMLDSSLSGGKTASDLKSLVSTDRRFSEIGKKSEFSKFFPIVNEASAKRSRPQS